jgi:hypothetical protein
MAGTLAGEISNKLPDFIRHPRRNALIAPSGAEAWPLNSRSAAGFNPSPTVLRFPLSPKAAREIHLLNARCPLLIWQDWRKPASTSELSLHFFDNTNPARQNHI